MEPQYESKSVQKTYALLKKHKLLSPSITYELKKQDEINQRWNKLFKETNDFILKYCRDSILDSI